MSYVDYVFASDVVWFDVKRKKNRFEILGKMRFHLIQHADRLLNECEHMQQVCPIMFPDRNSYPESNERRMQEMKKILNFMRKTGKPRNTKRMGSDSVVYRIMSPYCRFINEYSIVCGNMFFTGLSKQNPCFPKEMDKYFSEETMGVLEKHFQNVVAHIQEEYDVGS